MWYVSGEREEKVSEQNEPKLCPFRKWVDLKKIPDYYDIFGPCIEGKCQMWHPEHTETQIHELGVHEYIVQGYCGLAGKQ